MGKIGYAAAAMFPPRLSDSDDPPSPAIRSIQVSINDVARSTVGMTRNSHIPIDKLLAKASIPSFNHALVKATVSETWKTLHPANVSSSPLGRAIRDGIITALPRESHVWDSYFVDKLDFISWKAYLDIKA